MTIKFLRHGGLFSELKRRSLTSEIRAQPNEYTDRRSLDTTIVDVNHSDADNPIIASPCTSSASHPVKLHIRTIDELPDTFILQILRLLTVDELCCIRLVNRHLNRIVQRHHEVLAKKRLQGMTIYGLPNGELNFDKDFHDHPCFIDDDELDGTISCEPVWEFSLKHMCLDSALRHITLSDCLCIESAHFDHSLRHSLQRSFKGPLRRMEFIDCIINIRYDEFVAFIRRMRVNGLTILLCELEDAQLIGDDLFKSNTQLDFVSIQFDILQYLPLLTNDTLRHWAAAMAWPSSILLHNVKSSFDIVGIGLMIESYFLYCYRCEEGDSSFGHSPILWNFGRVDIEITEALITLRSIGDRAVILESQANKLVVIIRYSANSPSLHMRLECNK